MSIFNDMASIVGTEYVLTERNEMKKYLSDLSLIPEGYADAVIYPADTQQVSEAVKYCNEHKIAVVPVSSAVHLYGSSIPRQGGIIIDLRRLNKIHDIDLINRCVRFDAGVSWKQLTEALAEKNMRVIMPLAPRPDRSVATDHLEREVTTNMVYDYGEPMQSLEVVFPDGSIMRTGSASVNGFPDTPAQGGNPSGPGLDFYRLFQNAQGTMGIVTWMSLKIQSIPRIDKVYFAAIDSVENVTDFLFRILPRRIGQECLLLNRKNMAAILAEEGENLQDAENRLPEWTLVLVISGLLRRPEEKIQYEENFLREVIRNEYPGIRLKTELSGFAGAEKKMLKILREPWPEDKKYWKQRVKGGCQDIFFIARPEHAQKFIDTVSKALSKEKYDFSDTGIYIQPIEHNRACQIQFSLFYDDTDKKECLYIDRLSFDIAKTLHEQGAYFTRPYGRMASYLYDGAAGYTAALKRVKKLFDPNNIMNPGQLCF